MTVAEFGQLVRKMRDAQKEFFKTRCSRQMQRAKDLEKQVDNILSNSYFNPS